MIRRIKGRRSSVSFVKWISSGETSWYAPLNVRIGHLKLMRRADRTGTHCLWRRMFKQYPYDVAFKMAAVPEVLRVPKFKWIYYDTTIEFLVCSFFFCRIWIDESNAFEYSRQWKIVHIIYTIPDVTVWNLPLVTSAGLNPLSEYAFLPTWHTIAAFQFHENHDSMISFYIF